MNGSPASDTVQLGPNRADAVSIEPMGSRSEAGSLDVVDAFSRLNE
jgi:hypothetical protein